MSENKQQLMSESDFVAKINWEGGIVGALEYGLKSSDLEPGELRDAWKELEKAWSKMQEPMDEVQSLIDELTEDEY